ncbi:MAG TPA: hypothetical protein VN794_19390 [Methylomirabilota bacterium]|nr:hypothetical protein [Methylomirabilota bacterium]
MQNDHASSVPEECFKVGTVLAGYRCAIRGMDDQDVRGLQFGCGRKVVCAIRPEPSLGQERFPFLEETGMIMLAGAMGFWPGPDEDPQRLGGGA